MAFFFFIVSAHTHKCILFFIFGGGVWSFLFPFVRLCTHAGAACLCAGTLTKRKVWGDVGLCMIFLFYGCRIACFPAVTLSLSLRPSVNPSLSITFLSLCPSDTHTHTRTLYYVCVRGHFIRKSSLNSRVSWGWHNIEEMLSRWLMIQLKFQYFNDGIFMCTLHTQTHTLGNQSDLWPLPSSGHSLPHDSHPLEFSLLSVYCGSTCDVVII